MPNAKKTVSRLANSKVSSTFSEGRMSFQVIDKRGVRAVGQEAAVAEDSLEIKKPEELSFDLGSDPELVRLAHELGWRASERLEHEKAEKLIKGIIKARMGKATILLLHGKPWGTYRNEGVFAHRKFEEEHPGLFEQFSETVVTRELNVNKLRAAHPELYKQYLAATLRTTSK
jgi:hypothetical protein